MSGVEGADLRSKSMDVGPVGDEFKDGGGDISESKAAFKESGYRGGELRRRGAELEAVN